MAKTDKLSRAKEDTSAPMKTGQEAQVPKKKFSLDKAKSNAKATWTKNSRPSRQSD